MATTSRRKPSRAAVARVEFPDLATYCEKTGDTQIHIAAEVGTTQAHISRIAHGEVVPRAGLAARLARYARIPMDSFARAYLARQEAP